MTFMVNDNTIFFYPKNPHEVSVDDSCGKTAIICASQNLLSDSLKFLIYGLVCVCVTESERYNVLLSHNKIINKYVFDFSFINNFYNVFIYLISQILRSNFNYK